MTVDDVDVMVDEGDVTVDDAYIGTGTFSSCVKATKIFLMWQPRGVDHWREEICTRFRNLGISLKISGFQEHFKISCRFQDFM